MMPYRFHQIILRKLISTVVCSAIPILYLSPSHAASTVTPRYEISEYGSLKDFGTSVVVRNINSFKEVAAGLKRQNEKKISQATVLTANGIEDIPNDPGVDYSITYDLNDRDEVVGAVNTLTALRPFRSKRQNSFQMLVLLSGDSGGEAFAINDNGEAAGYSSGSSGEQAVWWPINGPARLLQGLQGSNSRALSINDHGDIVGTSATEYKHAVLWPNKGNLIELDPLPGFASSEAVSISNNGNIVGNATGTEAAPHYSRAVLWAADGQVPLDLGALSEGGESRAKDVNDRGEVVGTATGAHDSRAFIWTSDEGMRDLNALIAADGITLTEAVSINRNGDIVVLGYEHEASEHQGEHSHQDHERPRKIYVLTPSP